MKLTFFSAPKKPWYKRIKVLAAIGSVTAALAAVGGFFWYKK